MKIISVQEFIKQTQMQRRKKKIKLGLKKEKKAASIGILVIMTEGTRKRVRLFFK